VAVHDGDTLTPQLDLGFNMVTTQKLRLHGINAPELSTPEGKVALEFVRTWLRDHAPGPMSLVCPSAWVMVQTFKDKQEKYGRYLAEVEALSPTGVMIGPSLNNELLASGNAVVYMADR
jgi:micrococcal nuclease